MQDTSDRPPTIQPAPMMLLNVRQVAQMLSMSERNVRALVSSREFPSPLMIGRLSRWRVTDLERWIEDDLRRK